MRVTEMAKKREEKPERECAGELEEETCTGTEDERRTESEAEGEPSRRRMFARTRSKEEGNQTQREAWKKVRRPNGDPEEIRATPSRPWRGVAYTGTIVP
ncbi:hypothetical protein NDU88_002157 [Pleurodeles waltl]|uniref:Uncharacterized protein n=1 Tax=Pleurodeles waltl TaxID=8319 RepID=A0AAV7RBY1_PLEWA|nr:hypothetical protein NDU88_002157 [Pleurodeles waltl]